jgi:hypothetical protein
MGLLDLDLSGALGRTDFDGLMKFIDSFNSNDDDIDVDENNPLENNIDLSAIKKGLQVDLDIFAHPVYVKFPVGKLFELDIFTGAEARVNAGIPEKTIGTVNNIMGIADNVQKMVDELDLENFDYTDIEKVSVLPGKIDNLFTRLDSDINAIDSPDSIEVSASAFMEAGIGGSKTLLNDRLWIRAAPSVFFTLLYVEQGKAGMKGYADKLGGYDLMLNSNLYVYSAWNIDPEANAAVDLFASPGVDITLEAAYALFPMLDIGVSVSHIPIAPSTLKYKTYVDVDEDPITAPASMKTLRSLTQEAPDVPASPLDYERVNEWRSYIENMETKISEITNEGIDTSGFDVNTDEMLKYGEPASYKVRRPTRFDVYGIFKPFRTPILVLRPNVGATVHTVFNGDDPLFNWGLSIQFNAPKVFSASIGTGVTEGVFANRLGLAFDLRAFELDLGAGLTGTTYKESFSGNGLAAMVGIKLGW